MTGGGSLIWGFDKLIASKTGIPTARRGQKRFRAWRTGTGNCLENLSKIAGRHDESVAAETNESALTLYRGVSIPLYAICRQIEIFKIGFIVGQVNLDE